MAIAAHVGLIAMLSLSPPGKNLQPPPERMVVTFSDKIADQSTSPDPNAQAAPDVAPQLGEAPSAPEPAPVPPEPQPKPQPPQPKPQPAPSKPVPKPAPQPQPKPAPAAPAKPAPAKPAPAKPAPAKPAPAADDRLHRKPDAPSGGSRIGNDFLKGVPGSTNPGTSHTPPAAAYGPEVAATLGTTIARQIKPHWVAPIGVDVDKLVTILAFDLNPDGSLAGRPRLVQQLGVNDANRAQAQRHVEQAIRAVQLAAPFSLPSQYYALWKHIGNSRFDRNTSK